MTPPPDAQQGVAGLPWPGRAGLAYGSLQDLGERLRLVALAVSVLVLAVAGTVAPASGAGVDRGAGDAAGRDRLPRHRHLRRLAAAGPARRSAITATLATAATGPDPESAGATLDRSATFGLFATACSTRASHYSLLYEVYNRAASFQAAAAAPMVRSGGFGTALHR